MWTRSAWKWPAIEGLAYFKGHLLHTAQFDRNWTPDGRTVALIGTGSSAIQVLPKSTFENGLMVIDAC
jgi:cation diffusion facilitator CzcD-associated flavoprotein CzcO